MANTFSSFHSSSCDSFGPRELPGAIGCDGAADSIRMPSLMNAKTVATVACVDLFCGAGGLTYGFIQEGLPVVAGIDLDPACRYPYNTNNHAVFFRRDICDVASEEVAALFPMGALRVLAGCAPCQPFSSYSQRYDLQRDGKWRLLYEFGRIAEGFLPDVITMENVPRVSRHRVFKDFTEKLQSLGYSVWSAILECADYGVPQTRRRMVLLASRHGQIAMVPATHLPHRTVRDAIGSMPALKAGRQSIYDRLHTASSLSPLNLARIRASKPGGSWRDWPSRLVAECHKASTGRKYPSVYGRMEWDKPAPAITTQCHGFGNGRFGHPRQDRAISLREAAILQSFPRTYKFVPPDEPVQFTVIGRLIGNAVPVGLARAIARSILAHLSRLDSGPVDSGDCMSTADGSVIIAA